MLEQKVVNLVYIRDLEHRDVRAVVAVGVGNFAKQTSYALFNSADGVDIEQQSIDGVFELLDILEREYHKKQRTA